MQHEFAISRRQLLQRAGAGFGLVGLSGALHAAGALDDNATLTSTHVVPRAKRVIFLFMNGGPSQVDTFDPKPALVRHEGEALAPERNPEGKIGGLRPSPFRFRPHGDSGLVMSELFPRLAAHADDLCVIRSMHTDVPEHEGGLLVMHSGNQQPIRPSLGSWITYGLGTENQNLPSFVVISPGRTVVGPQLWSNAFLPGEYQGMSVDTNHVEVDKLVANLRHPSLGRDQQRRQLDLLSDLNRIHQAGREDEPWLDAQIRTMELAFNMQREAHTAFDVRRESAATRERYGHTPFGRSCLLARRLSERGVRFIQVYYVSKESEQPWDTHFDSDERHRALCADSDRATAALLTDLESRGMLDDTLVIWGGEFGRTPYSEFRKASPAAGRDHQHEGFSMLLAGGGIQGGLMYGATDDLGMRAIEKRVHVHDLHATVLHLLGIDHERLTYRNSGRDFRLTDVYGRIVSDILA